MGQRPIFVQWYGAKGPISFEQISDLLEHIGIAKQSLHSPCDLTPRGQDPRIGGLAPEGGNTPAEGRYIKIFYDQAGTTKKSVSFFGGGVKGGFTPPCKGGSLRGGLPPLNTFKNKSVEWPDRKWGVWGAKPPNNGGSLRGAKPPSALIKDWIKLIVWGPRSGPCTRPNREVCEQKNSCFTTAGPQNFMQLFCAQDWAELRN